MNDHALNEWCVVADGIRFMQSITQCYGVEKGYQIWETIAEAAGKEVKGKIMMAMLAGNPTLPIAISAGAAAPDNAVRVIKCMREHTGISLAQAKQVWDQSLEGRTVVPFGQLRDTNELVKLVNELTALGCTVHV
jgi:ribosomal protein L7/L12